MPTSCVICGSENYSLEEEWHGFQLARCKSCQVTFTLNPDYRPDAYEAAYKGAAQAPVPQEHAHVYVAPAQRLRLEALAYFVPPPRLTPAEKLALKWLKHNATKGDVILDCGCGSGRFLRALRRAGFHPVGVEVSADLVKQLRDAGFDALVGKAPDFPWDDPPPRAITFFEVLEHISSPVPVLQEIRQRFPGTAVLASVPSPCRATLLVTGKRGLSDYPPNHFLRWNPNALQIAFSRAGYRQVRVVIPPPIGSELLPGLGQVLFALRKQGAGHWSPGEPHSPHPQTELAARLRSTAALCVLYFYQRLADVIGYPKALQAKQKGASAGSMLVLAQP